MSDASFDATIIELIRARNPALLVETHEEERVVAALGAVATNEALRRPRKVVCYSLSRGLHEPGAQSGKALAPEKALQEAALAQEPTIFVFFDLHHSLGAGSQRGAEPGVVRAIRDLAEAFRSGAVPSTLVIVAPGLTLPVDLEKVVTLVELPLPDEDDIGEVLDGFLAANAEHAKGALAPEDRTRLVQAALGLTRIEAENAFARAMARDGTLDGSDISVVMEEKSQTIRKSGLLEFIPPAESLGDVGGLENLKRWLEKRTRAWVDDTAQWGVTYPKGILITGVPGCGKSLTAKCTSSLWSMPLLRLDIGRVFAGLVGSSEQNMRNALRLAEATSPSILWIDEIEKGFSSTGGQGDSGTSSRVFGSFLTWMQEKERPVFVIATANAIDRLPPELMRKGRFDEIFFVDLPTLTERVKIWEVHLSRRLKPGTAVAEKVTTTPALCDELARASEGLSGAEIEQAVISACFDAFSAQRPVTVEDLHQAVINTVPLSVTQAEQIAATRQWASERAVAATTKEDRGSYTSEPTEGASVAGWRGGRTIEF